jgi:peptide/nickel transport system substrate-binding protein
MAADMLRTMGITLEIKDVSSQGEMYSAAINGEADMWCAAWYGTAMTNMTNMTSRAFSSNGADNFFELSDELLDQRIALAETSLNLEFYRNALEAVLETAVIVPVYQRQMYFVFSGALDESTVETGLTTHYGWAEVLWKMRVTE